MLTQIPKKLSQLKPFLIRKKQRGNKSNVKVKEKFKVERELSLGSTLQSSWFSSLGEDTIFFHFFFFDEYLNIDLYGYI